MIISSYYVILYFIKLCHNISLCPLTEILQPPSIIDITTYSALVEFHSATRFTSSYGVEYALEEYEGATLTYSARGGEKVNAVNGQQVYRILQSYLKPGKKYHLRIVPFVRTHSTNRGIPSPVVQATILSPGQSGFFSF